MLTANLATSLPKKANWYRITMLNTTKMNDFSIAYASLTTKLNAMNKKFYKFSASLSNYTKYLILLYHLHDIKQG